MEHPHPQIIRWNFIFALVFTSADAADETSALIFASALWVLLIFAFASAPCRGRCADYWVSSNSSLYDTKHKRLSPEKAEGDRPEVISSILVISIVIYSDRGHCYEHLEKINLRWKLNAWHVFECLCMRWFLSSQKWHKSEDFDFSGPTCLS